MTRRACNLLACAFGVAFADIAGLNCRSAAHLRRLSDVSWPLEDGVAMTPGQGATQATSLNGFVEELLAASDGAQTLSDRDQTASDRDQTASDRDEAASAADQALADRELAAGGDPVEYALNTKMRERTSAERRERAAWRDQTARGRLRVATERDQASERRDTVSAANELALYDTLGRAAYLRLDDALATEAGNRAVAAVDAQGAVGDRSTAASLRVLVVSERAAEIIEALETDGLEVVTSFALADPEQDDDLKRIAARTYEDLTQKAADRNTKQTLARAPAPIPQDRPAGRLIHINSHKNRDPG